MGEHRIYGTSVASVYPLYVNKATRKGRSEAEVETILFWLTGHDRDSLKASLAAGTTFRDFFAGAPAMNPARLAVTGVICGQRIETLEDPLMREIRILDKLIDELAKGRPMVKILRGQGEIG